MKLRLFAAVVALAMATVAVHAQGGGLYINPIATRVGNSTADSGPSAFLGQNSTSQIFYGVTFGGYYNFFRAPGIDVAFDIHDSIQHANNASLHSFMVGIRVAGKPFATSIVPFITPTVGLGTTKAPTSLVHIDKLQYGVSAGLDYHAGKHIDLRMIEVGYNSLTTASSATIGASASVPSSSLITFTSGLVFRLP